MEAIDNYLWAMDDGKTISSQKEILVYSLRCATKMKNELKDYILKFNESERQREYEITMCDLWKMGLDHLKKAPRIDPNNIEFYKIVGFGFIRCLLDLKSEMKKRGLECFLDEKISILEGIMKERDVLALDYLFNPIMMNANFGPEEEKTPGETIPKKKPGRPKKTVLEAIIYKDMEIAYEVLKECLEGKNGEKLAYLVEAAIRLQLIGGSPSFFAMKEELGVQGAQYAFSKKFAELHWKGSVDPGKMESAMSTLKETLNRKQNNHGNN